MNVCEMVRGIRINGLVCHRNKFHNERNDSSVILAFNNVFVEMHFFLNKRQLLG